MTWLNMLMLLIPLLFVLVWAVPSGVLLWLGAHALLLAIGAAIVVALKPDNAA